MKSPYENALLWNAIGRDDQLMELLLTKATEHEQMDIYYKFKALNDNPVKFDLEKFCADVQVEKLEKEDNDLYEKKLKAILSKFTNSRRELNYL